MLVKGFQGDFGEAACSAAARVHSTRSGVKVKQIRSGHVHIHDYIAAPYAKLPEPDQVPSTAPAATATEIEFFEGQLSQVSCA